MQSLVGLPASRKRLCRFYRSEYRLSASVAQNDETVLAMSYRNPPRFIPREAGIKHADRHL
jgi:hypothetical protein